MSNSIWKTPDQKPENGQHILFFAGGGRLPYLGFYSQIFDIFEDWKSKDIQKWANVLDLIAQADKAERLQKALMKIATASPRDKASTLIDIACITLTPELEEGTNNDK